mmetsp:Transcript_44858/g.52578  ORF Transcript_44858/g.52578 Transcript_44858/m.52578 type:complete len:377 (+) Transcript_44858:58-1188(+)
MGAITEDDDNPVHEAAVSLPPWVSQKPVEMTPDNISTLQQQGYPPGLAMSLCQNALMFPLRFWVVDNSGSMNSLDGQKINENPDNNTIKILSCTRWEEIKECVNYHIQLSALINAPTTFRLLNPAHQFPSQELKVAHDGRNPSEVSEAMSRFADVSPGGVTPLTDNIRHIRNNVLTPIMAQLKTNGQKVALILATNGLPSDSRGTSGPDAKEEFLEALTSLEGFPVSIVIRLSTNDDDVVKFYNSINQEIDLAVRVVHDFSGEAHKIYAHNKWLTYGLQIHRYREFGCHHTFFNLLDERALTLSEIHAFCVLMFGKEQFDGVPHPTADFSGFTEGLKKIMRSCSKDQWNSVKKRVEPWINIGKLESIYGPSYCAIM